MTSVLGFCLTATLALAGVATNAGAAPEVDLALILAADVSRSMDVAEQSLQRDGYVKAFRHPDLVRAIESGPFGRIAVVYYEWAGPHDQSVVVPWTVIADGEDAKAFADALAARPILPEAGTSIGGSLLFAEWLFAVSGTTALRRTIDVSGDGPNSVGPPLSAIRDRLVAAGVTINGLPIELGTGRDGDVEDYYTDCVIGGAGAFAISVKDESRFAEAIRRKLVIEIAGLPPAVIPAAFVVARSRPADCTDTAELGGG